MYVGITMTFVDNTLCFCFGCLVDFGQGRLHLFRSTNQFSSFFCHSSDIGLTVTENAFVDCSLLLYLLGQIGKNCLAC